MNTQPDQYRKQLEQGTDFIASGTELFWSLEINFDKTVHFKTASGFDITTPAVAGVKAMDADVTRYAAETEKGRLTVQIMRLECTNDMSGKKSSYRVTVDAKDNKDKDPKMYEGCGQYLYDYRLNDIWVLESINNKKLSVPDFSKGLPRIEINIAQQKLFGHIGCNNINGAIEVQGKKIRFGYLVSTKMACSNIEFENRYLNSLSNQTIPYFIEPGRLHLQVNTDSTFIYRKID
ncbi:MAG: META domain-containing protein [Segetibacter sp.]